MGRYERGVLLRFLLLVLGLVCGAVAALQVVVDLESHNPPSWWVLGVVFFPIVLKWVLIFRGDI